MAIREKVNPLEIIQIALDIARDTDANEKCRLSALNFLAERGWCKPPSLHAKRVEHVSSVVGLLPAAWPAMGPEARRQFLLQLPPRPPEGDDQ